MPATPNHALSVEKYLRDNHISLSVYPYRLISSELFSTLRLANKYFKTVQARVVDYRDNALDYDPVNEQKTVDTVMASVQRAEPNFTPDRLKWKQLATGCEFFVE
eukprot:TRINITY_DN5607_c0_g1_i2.p1 TRINITY_DN5607_c0_g1~~TRINITY_DN5607_c0_g1_i2.p1  ORF type:complete len:105 (+),score=15.08 TRINITY_DN5607_c0_g1_i2:246-560(+)